MARNLHWFLMSGAKSSVVEEINRFLDDCLEVEFSFLQTAEIAGQLVSLPEDERNFVLDWTRRVATTNIQVAYQFVRRAAQAMRRMDAEMVSEWCLQAMDRYDSEGLRPALEVICDLDGYLASGRLRAHAARYEEVAPVLQSFIQGLSGRRLRMEVDASAWTDGETIFLPPLVARFESPEENFQLAKAMVTCLWAQTRYGTLNLDPQRLDEKTRPWFEVLESLRLEGLIARELPGLHRQMLAQSKTLGEPDWPDELMALLPRLLDGGAEESLRQARRLKRDHPPPLPARVAGMDLEAAWEARRLRLLRDEARFRDALRIIAEEMAGEAEPPRRFELREKGESENGLAELELIHADQVVPVPEHVRELMTSIQLDLTDIPEEYLQPAGPGEYDPSLLRDQQLDPDEVWSGSYHEEGAFFYDEWDFGRQGYRKRWCVLREHELKPGDAGFYAATLAKYRGLVKSLHRTFEILRGEEKTLRRQPHGEEVDIDAFVEAWGDVRSGLEMSDRLFTRLQKDERNIAVLFMVDMSGSTKGWINQAEREALVLLAESLRILGDRFAIYGFSGWARKRCEVYRIKTFDQPLDDRVKEAIAGIEPRDYTRMGAAIRHFTHLLGEVEARTKLLVTLSDGKPDDYDHYYRGEYGIEDTRQALFEARMAGVHPFCITIDREGADYLPHLYGKAAYVVLDEVAKLPLKVSDIYRKITT